MEAPVAAAPARWQQALAQSYSSAGALLAALGLSPTDCDLATTTSFPLRVPRGFVARMRPRDPADPLLRQVLPVAAEETAVAGYVGDAVGDLAAARSPGLIQKYAGRALVLAAGACAVHCRYCFRREFPYADHSQSPEHLATSLATLADDRSIDEVILSGGDPLLRPDRWLGDFAAAVDALPHIARLRVHSRLPVVLPERIDSGLLASLGRFSRTRVMVIHCNHPQEIDASVRTACEQLRGDGWLLLNQAVLLAGVNDTVAAQAGLARRLAAAGVLPYYLHQLDRVRGTAHFAVPDTAAVELMAALRAELPGYLVPRLVREVPGAPAKLPL
jgi:EF-P beta-lysylation protein EpmB